MRPPNEKAAPGVTMTMPLATSFQIIGGSRDPSVKGLAISHKPRETFAKSRHIQRTSDFTLLVFQQPAKFVSSRCRCRGDCRKQEHGGVVMAETARQRRKLRATRIAADDAVECHHTYCGDLRCDGEEITLYELDGSSPTPAYGLVRRGCQVCRRRINDDRTLRAHRLARVDIHAHNAILSGNAFLGCPTKTVEALLHHDVVKTDLIQKRQKLCLRQSASNSTGPKIDVPADGFR